MLLKRIIHYTYRPWAMHYIQKDRAYRFQGLILDVPKGVFHPGLFFSSKLLSKYIMSESISGKSLLELGCGTGMIACVAARSGANVTASDINPIAVASAASNAAQNQLSVHTIESDLFNAIPSQTFDYIIINPPYYPRAAQTMAERAWFAGEDLEYFQRLLSQIRAFMNESSVVLFSVSQDVDMSAIGILAEKHGLRFVQRLKKWTLWEWNYVYQLRISA